MWRPFVSPWASSRYQVPGFRCLVKLSYFPVSLAICGGRRLVTALVILRGTLCLNLRLLESSDLYTKGHAVISVPEIAQWLTWNVHKR